jgi:hypothetical protein
MLFINFYILLLKVDLSQILFRDFGKVIEKWGEVPLELLGLGN